MHPNYCATMHMYNLPLTVKKKKRRVVLICIYVFFKRGVVDMLTITVTPVFGCLFGVFSSCREEQKKKIVDPDC